MKSVVQVVFVLAFLVVGLPEVRPQNKITMYKAFDFIGHPKLLDFTRWFNVLLVVDRDDDQHFVARITIRNKTHEEVQIHHNIVNLIARDEFTHIVVENTTDNTYRILYDKSNAGQQMNFNNFLPDIVEKRGLGIFKDNRYYLHVATVNDGVKLDRKDKGWATVKDLSTVIHDVEFDSNSNTYIIHGDERDASVLRYDDLFELGTDTRVSARSIHGVTRVNHIYLDSQNTVFFSTDNGVKKLTEVENVATYLRSDRFLLCGAGAKDIVFCATRNRMYQINHKASTSSQVVGFQNQDELIIKDHYFRFIGVSIDEHVFFTTDESGVYIGTTTGTEVERVDFPNSERIRDMVVYNYAFVLASNLYVVSTDGKVTPYTLPPGDKYMIHSEGEGFIAAFNELHHIQWMNATSI